MKLKPPGGSAAGNPSEKGQRVLQQVDQEFYADLRPALHDRFGIKHATFQVEAGVTAGSFALAPGELT